MAGHPLIVFHTALPNTLARTEISNKTLGPVLSCTVLLEMVTFWQPMLHQMPGPPLPYTTFWSTSRLLEVAIFMPPACHCQSQPPKPLPKIMLPRMVECPSL